MIIDTLLQDAISNADPYNLIIFFYIFYRLEIISKKTNEIHKKVVKLENEVDSRPETTIHSN